MQTKSAICIYETFIVNVLYDPIQGQFLVVKNMIPNDYRQGYGRTHANECLEYIILSKSRMGHLMNKLAKKWMWKSGDREERKPCEFGQ
jgi:hypothetical protein